MTHKFICRGKFDIEKKQAQDFQYIWIVENFRNALSITHGKDYVVHSDVITVSGRKWSMYIKACQENEFKLTGLYLTLIKTRDQGETSVELDWTILLLGKDDKVLFYTSYTNTFVEGSSYGVADFLIGKFLYKNDLVIKLQVLDNWDSKLIYIPDAQPESELTEAIKLSNDYLALKQNESFSDFEIIVDGTSLKVHKNILSGRSEYFCKLFASEMKENLEKKLLIEDFSLAIVEKMLEYIYSGQINEDPRDSIEEYFLILSIADKYLLEGLKTMCEKRIIENVALSSATKIYTLSQEYPTEIVNDYISIFIKENIETLKEDKTFQRESRKRPHDFMDFYIPKRSMCAVKSCIPKK